MQLILLIENLDVKPGFEKALDALLGDELYHSFDTENDIHWRKNSIKENTQSLPTDVNHFQIM